MEDAILLVIAMLVMAPIAGYMQATAWALKNDLIRKEALHDEPLAMNLH